jgi:hypothetical protein
MDTLTFTEKVSRRLIISADALGDTDWHYEVATIPGTYIARCVTDGPGKPCSLEDAYWVVVTVDATCTGGWIPGHGGRNEAMSSVGKPMPYTIQVYGHQVRDSLAGDDSCWGINATVVA